MINNKCAKHIYSIWFFKLSLIISAFLIVVLFPFSVNALDILLGTGKPRTFSHFSGRILCRIINNYSNELYCKTVPAPGDVHNLTNLREGGIDIGLIDSRMLLDAVNKAGQFKFFDIGYENLRSLLPLYAVPITLVVRSDSKISSLDDLKGKRINAGAPLSLEHLGIDTIMKAKNWKKEDFILFGEISSSKSQDTMAFCHGMVQAMIHIGVHPDPSLEHLLKICNADLVNMYDNDIQKLINDHPAFWKIIIAADTYPFHAKEITTFGTRAMLVTSEALDEETAYQIIDAIYSSRERLKSAHPSLSLFSVNEAQKSAIGVQLHPGAVKYFSKRGMQ